jgi:hypothetical protein
MCNGTVTLQTRMDIEIADMDPVIHDVDVVFK